jgi:hypothetical protein
MIFRQGKSVDGPMINGVDVMTAYHLDEKRGEKRKDSISYSGDGVNAAGVKRVAFQQAPACQGAALQRAVFQDSLGCICGARRIKPAAGSQKRRNHKLIRRDSKIDKISNRI